MIADTIARLALWVYLAASFRAQEAKDHSWGGRAWTDPIL